MSMKDERDVLAGVKAKLEEGCSGAFDDAELAALKRLVHAKHTKLHQEIGHREAEAHRSHHEAERQRMTSAG